MAGSDTSFPHSYLMGTQDVLLFPGTPYSVNLESWSVPINFPTGNYKVCAWIDPGNDVVETSGTDNTVVTDPARVLTVVDTSAPNHLSCPATIAPPWLQPGPP